MDLRMSNYGTDILHHSRFSMYRQPFGAVALGESVLLRISVAESFPDVTALCAYWIWAFTLHPVPGVTKSALPTC